MIFLSSSVIYDVSMPWSLKYLNIYVGYSPRTCTSPQKLFLKLSSLNAARISFGFGVNGYKVVWAIILPIMKSGLILWPSVTTNALATNWLCNASNVFWGLDFNLFSGIRSSELTSSGSMIPKP